MLTHPTHDALRALKLDGMAEVLAELLAREDSRQMDPVDWIGLMLDRESATRDTRRFQARLRAAKLRDNSACLEDVDYKFPRRLDRPMFQSLRDGRWISKARPVLITGPCGVGKSWLACALGHEACRQGKTVLYFRMPRLLADLAAARGDGSYDRLFRKIARADVLILDDWGPEQLTAPQRRDLMEIIDERYGRKATVVTSQLPIDTWHDMIGDPTFADAILDRLVHNAHKFALDGPSMRKTSSRTKQTSEAGTAP
jgi:DNA replication protein DnaC